MSYTVLARRYRSQSFDEVIGQDATAQTLKNAIKTDRVAHAYLFTGTRGVGKTTMARILAKALNCLAVESPTTGPCCKCDSCVAINIGEDIDVIEIDGASNTGVDNIRELRQNAIYRPARARYKIYIIDEVHMLSVGAFNALLKILEEPPGHIKFIFATTEPNKVLATIQSRCQRFDFAGISPALIAEQLKRILKKEKIKSEDDLILGLARLANGSMRDGLSLLDQLISTGIQPLTASMLEEFLGQPNREKIHGLAARIAEGEPARTLAAIDDLLTAGQSPAQLVVALIDYMRDLMVIKSTDKRSNLLVLTAEQRKQAGELAEKFDIEALIYNITALEKVRWVIKNTDTPRALLEASMLRLTLSEHFMDVSALVARRGNNPTGTAAGQARGKRQEARSARPETTSGNSFSAPDKLDLAFIKANWRRVIEALTSRDARLAARLSCATPTGFEKGTLTLSFAPFAAMAAQLCEADTEAAKIQALLSDVLASPVKLVFTVESASQNKDAPAKPRPRGAKTSQKTKNDIAGQPAVKTLLTGLDAKIIDVEES